MLTPGIHRTKEYALAYIEVGQFSCSLLYQRWQIPPSCDPKQLSSAKGVTNPGSTPLGTCTTCFRLWEPLCGPAMVSTPPIPRWHLQYPFLSTAQLSKWDWISSHFPSSMSGQRSDAGERPTSTGRTKTKAKAQAKERVTGAQFKFLQLTWD